MLTEVIENQLKLFELYSKVSDGVLQVEDNAITRDGHPNEYYKKALFEARRMQGEHPILSGVVTFGYYTTHPVDFLKLLRLGWRDIKEKISAE